MATREREKAAKRKENKDPRPYAIARDIRISSSKVKVVLDLIRGKSYADAVAILSTTNKSACLPVLKAVQSAGANAENNMNIAKDNTYVAECWSMAGKTLKRMMPRARGSANRILKRTSHIKIILDEQKDVKTVSKTKAVSDKAIKTAAPKSSEEVAKKAVKESAPKSAAPAKATAAKANAVKPAAPKVATSVAKAAPAAKTSSTAKAATSAADKKGGK